MNITQSIVSERDRALLGGDYDSYHAQAVRRIHTLRRKLGNATPRGRKYIPKTPVTAQNIGQNPEWVQLLLADSERAWAHAMVMKSSQSMENIPKQMAGSTKRQIASRYRRAITYATNLVEALSDRSTSKSTSVDVLEAKAYLALLKGGLDFEKNRWQQCIHDYAVAHLIYNALASTSKSDVYKELLSTTIDPSIRFAAYHVKLPRTKAIRDIAIENFPKSEAELRSEIQEIDSKAFVTSSEESAQQTEGPTNLPSTITWRTRKVKIEDASISQALGISQDKDQALHKSFESYQKGDMTSKDLAVAYNDVIDARQDAVDTTKNAIDELRAEGIDQGDSRVQALQVTRTAINYAVIEWRIGRNRVLCGSDDGLIFDPEVQKQNSKPRKDGKSYSAKEESSGRRLARLRERVTLYDSILQNIDAVKELPGVVADSEFVEELDGKKLYFRALKCLTIGRSHAVEGRVSNALALYARASDLAKQSLSQLKSPSKSTDSPPKLDITSTQLTEMSTHLSSLTLQYRALTELSNINKSTSTATKASAPPMIERMHHNQYDDSVDLTNLVNYPPKLQPVPVKPIFYDLAWNYIQYPGKAPETVANTAARPPPPPTSAPAQEEKTAKRGWFGFGR